MDASPGPDQIVPDRGRPPAPFDRVVTAFDVESGQRTMVRFTLTGEPFGTPFVTGASGNAFGWVFANGGYWLAEASATEITIRRAACR